MSEVRIIDANKMKDHVTFQKDILANMGKDMEEIGNILVNMINEEIDLQPTVDAVPVEWIESYVRDASATGDFEDEMSAVAIEAMLNDYRAGGERRSE